MGLLFDLLKYNILLFKKYKKLYKIVHFLIQLRAF